MHIGSCSVLNQNSPMQKNTLSNEGVTLRYIIAGRYEIFRVWGVGGASLNLRDFRLSLRCKWDVARSRLVVRYRRFGTATGSHLLQESSSPELIKVCI